jgi:2'-5' RNA ligase
MALTNLDRHSGQPVHGYMINTLPSDENRRTLTTVQEALAQQYGDGLWIAPPETLHITLLDWVAPLVDYDQPKDALFKEVYPQFDEVFADIVRNTKPIMVTFDTIKATAGAIIALGNDDGSFQYIRDEFMRRVTLPPGTKLPPTIIHSTIARYRKEYELIEVENFVAAHQVNFTQQVREFRLLRERVSPQLDFDLLKTYQLGGA